MTAELDTPNEVLESITDAFYSQHKNGVSIIDVHQINACNHVISGEVEHDGKMMGFIVEMGDINGCLVRAWGPTDDVGVYRPEPVEQPTFLPQDDNLFYSRPEMFAVYLHWRKEEWFTKKIRAYLYDRHFQPGGAIEKNYREWANTKGLRIGYLSSQPKEVVAAILAN